MAKGKVIGFSATKLKKQLMANAIKEQNRRFVEYAKKEIDSLGKKIASFPYANHMDRTGNLLNSLCWIVSYDGKTIDSGFYRDAKTNTYTDKFGKKRGKGVSGSQNSFLHELFDDAELVNGRKLAEEFIKSFKGSSHKWKIAFAVLAPYWGYWESGHTNAFSGKFQQFQVMTHIYDEVRTDMKPAETRLSVYVPKYIYKSIKWKKKLKNRVGIKKIGLVR
jgi:hypothetical protein